MIIFSDKENFKSYNTDHMILVYFPSDGCVDDVVNNQANYQFTSVIVVHFMNSARVCWIIRRIIFNMYSV